MKPFDLVGTAIANTFRSKTRTILTILSIFIGAFTLTLTSGLGTGINAYIADTVSGVGASDAMTVSKPIEGTDPFPDPDSGPTEYDPEAIDTQMPGMSTQALMPDDLTEIEDIEGVNSVDPQKSINLDYVQHADSDQFLAQVGELIPGQTAVLAAGDRPDDNTDELQAALPQSYIESLGFENDRAAIGQSLTIGLTDANRQQHTTKATIVAVTEPGLNSPTGESLLINRALSDQLFETQATGLPDDQIERYAQATAWFDDDATDAQVEALKDRLADAGYTGTTLDDQLGMITAVIDGIVLVLNAFAVIALLAAAFGIVNTLYMSVQERTREIGLMKAMGLGGGKIFGIFSLEAAFIGFLGSALGVVVAIVTGTALSDLLAAGPLSDLAGLTLIAFDPVSILGIIALVMVIAFLAGTLPAARAARNDPVESLRYE